MCFNEILWILWKIVLKQIGDVPYLIPTSDLQTWNPKASFNSVSWRKFWHFSNRTPCMYQQTFLDWWCFVNPKHLASASEKQQQQSTMSLNFSFCWLAPRCTTVGTKENQQKMAIEYCHPEELPSESSAARPKRRGQSPPCPNHFSLAAYYFVLVVCWQCYQLS